MHERNIYRSPSVLFEQVEMVCHAKSIGLTRVGHHVADIDKLGVGVLDRISHPIEHQRREDTRAEHTSTDDDHIARPDRIEAFLDGWDVILEIVALDGDVTFVSLDDLSFTFEVSTIDQLCTDLRTMVTHRQYCSMKIKDEVERFDRVDVVEFEPRERSYDQVTQVYSLELSLLEPIIHQLGEDAVLVVDSSDHIADITR